MFETTNQKTDDKTWPAQLRPFLDATHATRATRSDVRPFLAGLVETAAKGISDLVFVLYPVVLRTQVVLRAMFTGKCCTMVKHKCMKWLTHCEIMCNHKYIWQYFLSGEIYAWNSSPHWLSIPAFSPFIQRYKTGWNHLMGQSYDT